MTCSVEVVSDEVKRLYASGGCKYDPYRHLIVENEWIRCCRRATRRPDLFLYFHVKNLTLVLAYWIVKPNKGRGPGLMLELEVFRDDRPSIEYVIQRCKPMGEMLKETERQLEAANYEEMMASDETERQKADTVRWLKNKGRKYEDIGRKIERGDLLYLGDREGGQQLAEMRKTLDGLVKEIGREKILNI